ncbi:VWA domain-containing protein [Patulibacter brassicae]|uniref:Mg-protoporphyrin IX chelatase n=1 Tax=Patulibacter brassicae TaxID=1705717 RepID=A0ABU4VI78_9ACTN|nr:VWA domain-containing protein [Patulibacter brassicae]MDX8151536.1 VWA domain-containing protein [Patulibacter brassicae]
MTSPGSVRFPLSALVGQDDLRRALLVNAVAPEVGGVLVRGERGTAKTTAVRGLEPLLPPLEVVAGCPYGSAPAEASRCPCPACAALVAGAPLHEPATATRPAALVELPVGATVDRVVGTLDLERALRDGEAALQPGLLARAHRGILYVDEVNLLGDHLVDVLLDAAAQGEATVERDGISVRHPARFLLVGTMNPEEGDLRPQLLDRFGLSVTVAGSTDPATRAEVVRRRLAFEADPVAFAARFADEDARIAAAIAAAAARLPAVRLGERALRLITGACARLGVDGLRADLVAARCSRAIAALAGRDEVSEEDVREALLLTLPHRRRRGPLDPPGLEPDELDEALDEARGDEDEPPTAPPQDDDGPDDDRGPGDRGPAPDDAPPDARDAPPAGSGDDAPEPPPASEPGEGPADDDPAAEAPAPPPVPDPAPPADEPPADRPFRPGAAARTRRDAPTGTPGVAPLLELVRGRGAHRTPSGRRSRTAGEAGHQVDTRPRETDEQPLALPATLRGAALREALAARGGRTGRLRVTPGDQRTPVRAGREGTLVVFCVDASGSMGARRRMGAVKDAALGLLMDAYQRRDRVALVTFRGRDAEVVLPPTGSVERAATRLADLPTGGGTPLAAGLDAATTLVRAHRLRDPGRRVLCLVVTDGRASGGRTGLAAAERAAARLGRVADGVVVFDSEQGRVRLGLSARIAAAAGPEARLLPIGALAGEAPRARVGAR